MTQFNDIKSLLTSSATLAVSMNVTKIKNTKYKLNLHVPETQDRRQCKIKMFIR